MKKKYDNIFLAKRLWYIENKDKYPDWDIPTWPVPEDFGFTDEEVHMATMPEMTSVKNFSNRLGMVPLVPSECYIKNEKAKAKAARDEKQTRNRHKM